MISINSVVRRKPDLISSDLDGETVMMSIEQGHYYALDAIGGRIWKILETPCRVESIVTTLLNEFDCDEETCRRDTIDFLNELQVNRIVEEVDAAE